MGPEEMVDDPKKLWLSDLKEFREHDYYDEEEDEEQDADDNEDDE